MKIRQIYICFEQLFLFPSPVPATSTQVTSGFARLGLLGSIRPHRFVSFLFSGCVISHLLHVQSHVQMSIMELRRATKHILVPVCGLRCGRNLRIGGLEQSIFLL